jgi:hypothetical protein
MPLPTFSPQPSTQSSHHSFLPAYSPVGKGGTPQKAFQKAAFKPSASRHPALFFQRSLDAKWTAFQDALATFIEKGKPLQLPPFEQCPSLVQPELKGFLETLTPEKLLAFKANQQFGLCEETSDLFYYFTLQVLRKSDVLTEDRLRRFKDSLGTLMTVRNPENFQTLRNWADRSIDSDDIQKMGKAFNIPLTPKTQALFKKMIQMYLVDYAIFTQGQRQNGNLASYNDLQKKLLEETQELGEQLQDLKGNGKALDQTLKALIQPFMTAPNPQVSSQEYQGLFQGLQTLAQQATPENKVSIESLLKFAIIKSSARTEHIYNNPTRRYEDLKIEAKAWEKFFEAAYFMMPGETV